MCNIRCKDDPGIAWVTVVEEKELEFGKACQITSSFASGHRKFCDEEKETLDCSHGKRSMIQSWKP